MNTTATNLYQLSLREWRTYLYALLFIVGNIALPSLCHLIPNGGHIFLPIYFFTLIGAYKYGLGVGLLTAVTSPVVNNILFGMPPSAVLPAILIKSVLLAIIAAYTSHKWRKVSIPLLLQTVLFYQIIGSTIEIAITGSMNAAFTDFTLGLPGMAIQVIGGYLVIKYLLKN